MYVCMCVYVCIYIYVIDLGMFSAFNILCRQQEARQEVSNRESVAETKREGRGRENGAKGWGGEE